MCIRDSSHGGLDSDHFVQLTNESLSIDPLKDKEDWVKLGPNEQLDLAVYAYAGALMFGLTRMSEANWKALFEREAIDPALVNMGPLERLMETAPDLPRQSDKDLDREDERRHPAWLTKLQKLNKEAGDT